MRGSAPARVSRCCFFFIALGMAGGTVCANDTAPAPSPALDRVSLWLGGYAAHTDTTLGAELNRPRINGRLNLQHDLGFPSRQSVPRVRLDVLLGQSQGFSFDYYRIEQSRTRTLAKAVGFEGDTFGATASVTGRVNFDFGSAAYRWWFGHGSDVFGLGVGAAYYRVRAGISGQATVYGSGLGQISGQTSAYTGLSAWAPELQLGWRHAFSHDLRMYLNASGVRKNGHHLGGHIYDAALGVEWFPWTHLGVAAEYDCTRIDIRQGHRTYNNDIAMRMNGPSLFLRLRF